MEKLHILQIVSNLSVNSGVSSVVINLFRSIDREKFQFDFLVVQKVEKSYEEEILKLGGNIYYLFKPNLINLLKFTKKIDNFLSSKKNYYKIAHIHIPTLMTLFYPYFKKHDLNNRIIHSHNSKLSNKRINYIRNRIMIFRLKEKANGFVACSKSAGEALFGTSFFNKGKVLIINNAVSNNNFMFNPETRLHFRDKFNISDKKVIGHVGRFVRQKNHFFLIKVFSEVIKKDRNAVLILIGDGPLRKSIEKKVKKLRIEKNVFFLGAISNVNQIMQTFDLFILPSLFEGLPVVAIEAQSLKLKSILSNTITNETIISNKVKMLNLKLGAKIWSNEILSIMNDNNNYKFTEITNNSNFDLLEETKKLEKYYMSFVRKD